MASLTAMTCDSSTCCVHACMRGDGWRTLDSTCLFAVDEHVQQVEGHTRWRVANAAERPLLRGPVVNDGQRLTKRFPQPARKISEAASDRLYDARASPLNLEPHRSLVFLLQVDELPAERPSVLRSQQGLVRISKRIDQSRTTCRYHAPIVDHLVARLSTTGYVVVT